jgi:hypothetical protein
MRAVKRALSHIETLSHRLDVGRILLSPLLTWISSFDSDLLGIKCTSKQHNLNPKGPDKSVRSTFTEIWDHCKAWLGATTSRGPIL